MFDLKNDLDSLLQKEMDRKDFLKLIGVGAVAVTGVASLIKTLSSLDGGSAVPRGYGYGYGSSPYGGEKRPRRTR